VLLERFPRKLAHTWLLEDQPIEITDMYIFQMLLSLNLFLLNGFEVMLYYNLVNKPVSHDGDSTCISNTVDIYNSKSLTLETLYECC